MTWLEMGAQGLAARVAWNMGSSPAVGVGPVARWEEQLGPARALPGSRVLPRTRCRVFCLTFLIWTTGMPASTSKCLY